MTLWDNQEQALNAVATGVKALLQPGAPPAPSPWRVRRRLVLGGAVLAVIGAAGLLGRTESRPGLDVFEVTNAEFAAWLNLRRGVVVDEEQVREAGVLLADLHRDEARSSGLAQEGGRFQSVAGLERRPVVQVSYAAAQRYCAWRGARLPRSAEWLAAACGLRLRAYPFGDQAPRCDGVVFGRHDGACQGLPVAPADVGSSAQDRTSEERWDLGGNVAEWVVGERSGEVRGGNFARAVTSCRDPRRVELSAEDVRSNVGFRCAR